MARIAAAFGSSHSVMLTCEVEDWVLRFRDRDHVLPFYDRAGNRVSWQQALAAAPADAASYITREAIERRFADTQAAMDAMRDKIRAARLDTLVIIGDDQQELFHDNNMPSIGIFWGDKIRNAAQPPTPDPDWYKRAQLRRHEPAAPIDYPCNGALGLHFIEGLIERGFDVGAVKYLREGEAEGHAYSFIHHRYLHGTGVPIVPIFMNTYFAPN